MEFNFSKIMLDMVEHFFHRLELRRRGGDLQFRARQQGRDGGHRRLRRGPRLLRQCGYKVCSYLLYKYLSQWGLQSTEVAYLLLTQ